MCPHDPIHISVLTGLTGVFLARFSFFFYSKCNVIFNQKQGSKVSLVVHLCSRQQWHGSGAVSHDWSHDWSLLSLPCASFASSGCSKKQINKKRLCFEATRPVLCCLSTDRWKTHVLFHYSLEEALFTCYICTSCAADGDRRKLVVWG